MALHHDTYVYQSHALTRLSLWVILIVGSAILFRLWKAASAELREVPGPYIARLTRLWYLKKCWNGDFEKTNIQLHKKHGKVVRIAPNEYSFDDSEAARVIYGHGSNFIKGPWYSAFENPSPDVHDLFTERNPKCHADIRRKLASYYSMTGLLSYEPFVVEGIRNLVAAFKNFAREDTVCNLQAWAQFWAYDTIGLMTFGSAFGFVDRGEDTHGLLKANHDFLFFGTHLGILAELHPYIGRLLNLSPSGGFRYLQSFSNSIIDNRIKYLTGVKHTTPMTTDRMDMLTKLLQLHFEDPQKLPLETVRVACLTNVGAGSDTTAISLTSIIYHLAKRPEVFQRLRAEIDLRLMSDPGRGDLVSFAEAQKMPYLQACIKEGLRLHPATGLPLSRVVPKGGAQLCGRHFPEGTIVGVNAWVAHQNELIFGEDAHVFRPERWLVKPDLTSSMDKYFLSFGSGSRTCIGRNVSLLEISKLLPELVRRFDFHLVDPSAEVKSRNVFFVKQKNIAMKISLRSEHNK